MLQVSEKALYPATSRRWFLRATRNTKDWGTNEEIFAAASNGDLPRLDHLVSRGTSVDVQVGFLQMVPICVHKNPGEAEFGRNYRQVM